MPNSKKTLTLTALACFLASAPVHATCWEEASKAYGIPVSVLKAVAQTESGFRAEAKNLNTNGTDDLGFMQINSAWLPKLVQYGVTRESLNDSCTNLKVGAWILSNNAKRLGWNWNAIGAYNVGCAKLSPDECEKRRNRYAWKIHAALNKVRDIGKPKHQTEKKGDASGASAGVSYAEDATDVSRKAIRGQRAAVQPRRIMVVKMGGSGSGELRQEDASPMQVASLDAVTAQPRFMSVGDFLNYKDESEHE